MTVIDFHVHLTEMETLTPNIFELLSGAYPARKDFEAFCIEYSNPHHYLRLMDQSEVDYAVVVAGSKTMPTSTAMNELVEDFCRVSPRLIPFCTLNPYRHPKIGQKLEDLCLNHGFKGLKLYPPYNHFYPNDQLLYPLYAVAERLGLPVHFHTGSSIFANNRIKYGNPIYFDDVAVDFPDMKIIMAHGGRGPWYDEAMSMVRLHKNVYIDIAGLPPVKILEIFPDMERFAHKFIFGTDWPTPVFNLVNRKAAVIDVKKNIKTIKNLNISQAAIAKILGENAHRLLGLL
ncbi:MAG: amidohydrolase family protein [Desulfotomaculaceae bacterium]|nr:amidohydrolase family protein [Desulfotomaculaceae bacterium]